MKVTARVQNRHGEHDVTVATNGNDQHIAIPPKATGSGSSVNGGKLLFLALATCYCNDIYREAAKREITVHQVEVEVDGEFGGEGQSARHISYRARVIADAEEVEIRGPLRRTDTVAEIQNVLRIGIPVTLNEIEAVSVRSAR